MKKVIASALVALAVAVAPAGAEGGRHLARALLDRESLGAQALEPEKSKNLSVGAVLQTGDFNLG